MIKTKHKIKHIVGEMFYDDKTRKTIPHNHPKKHQQHFNRKYFFFSSSINPKDKIGFIEIQLNLTKNEIKFLKSRKNNCIYTADINNALVSLNKPYNFMHHIPKTKNYIFALPLEQWHQISKGKDKKQLLKNLYPNIKVLKKLRT